MKSFKLHISLILALFFLFSCKKEEVQTGPVEFMQIARGSMDWNLPYFPPKTGIKITNQATLNTIKSNIESSFHNYYDSLNEVVDFEQYNLLFTSHRRGSTFVLTMESAEQTADSILVHSNIGVGAGSAITHRFHIYRIPKIDKPVGFTWQGD